MWILGFRAKGFHCRHLTLKLCLDLDITFLGVEVLGFLAKGLVVKVVRVEGIWWCSMFWLFCGGDGEW